MDTPKPTDTPISGAPQGAVAPEKELVPGQIIENRYKILSLVGRGGNGSIYKVEQILLKRMMALKTLNPVSVSDLMLMRFQKEAQAASRLEHPNLVRAVDFGMIKGNQPFLVMDFVEGRSLNTYLRKQGSLSVDQALEIFIPVCRGLSYAHQLGVIHRDIKPGNIVLVASENGKFIPKIVDFGIAKLDIDNENTEVQSLTKTGEVFGTPLYMSPEQCAGTRSDQRSDIYSLGCVIFEALTGAPPFRGDTALATMMQHTNTPSLSLKEASIGQQFPPALESIVAKMLAKNPADRYQNCEELCQHLLWLQEGNAQSIEKANQSFNLRASAKKQDRHSLPPPRNHILSLAGVFVSIAAIIAVICFSYSYLKQSEKHSSQTKAPAAQPDTVDLDQTIPTIAGSDMPDKSFSHLNEKGDKRIFKFPPKVSMGDFYCWDAAHKLSIVTARSEIEIPVSSKVIYNVGAQATFEPYYASYLQTDDFDGLAIDCNQLGELIDDNVDRLANTLLQFPSLHSIYLKKTKLLDSTFNKISDLPDLRLLNLQRTHESAAVIANLKSLGHVRVLALDTVTKITPIMRRIARDPIMRRLMLAHCEISDADWSLLSQMHKLDTLDLLSRTRETKVVSAQLRRKIFDAIAEMPQLERLSVSIDDTGMFGTDTLPDSEIRTLKSLPNLKELVVDFPTPGQLAQLKKELPRCTITKATNRTEVEGWFDPRTFDVTTVK